MHALRIDINTKDKEWHLNERQYNEQPATSQKYSCGLVLKSFS